MWFNNKVIEDIAIKQIKGFRSNSFQSKIINSMDSLTKNPSKRIARSVVSTESSSGQERAKKHKRKPFWQVAPDGKTIERLYEPDQEPLLV